MQDIVIQGQMMDKESDRLPERTLAAPIMQIDLLAEADGLRRRESYIRGEPTGKTVVKEPDLRIVVMALKGGARLEEHRTSGPISIQVLQGHIRLTAGNDGADLRPGQLLTVESGIPHDVEAVEDSEFLLTIGRTMYQQVSDHHEMRTRRA